MNAVKIHNSNNQQVAAAALLFLVLFCTTTYAGDWPHWRGPDRNGISQEKGWNAKWPAEGRKTGINVK